MDKSDCCNHMDFKGHGPVVKFRQNMIFCQMTQANTGQNSQPITFNSLKQQSSYRRLYIKALNPTALVSVLTWLSRKCDRQWTQNCRSVKCSWTFCATKNLNTWPQTIRWKNGSETFKETCALSGNWCALISLTTIFTRNRHLCFEVFNQSEHSSSEHITMEP